MTIGLERFGEPGDIADIVEQLRRATTLLRAAHAGPLAVRLANYNTETHELNSQLLGDCLRLLPIDLGYPDHPGAMPADRFVVPDAAQVQMTTAFGAFLDRGYASRPGAGLLIGERTDEQNPALTELLFASHERKIEDDQGGRRWRYEPLVYVARVATESWRRTAAGQEQRLRTPVRAEQLTTALAPGKGCVIQNNPNVFDMLQVVPATPRFLGKDIADLKPTAMIRALGRTTDPEQHVLGAVDIRRRSLLGTDFDDFGVAGHLTLLAAAYGVDSGRYDKLMAEYAAQLPPHPVEAELPNYRTVIGTDAVRRVAGSLPLSD